MVDWEVVLSRLRTYPDVNFLEPPCSKHAIEVAEERIGSFPADLRRMLQLFNGGELYVVGGAFATLFGISSPEDPPSDFWFIDRYTPLWRSEQGRPSDLVIGIRNYDAIVVLEPSGVIREWDNATRSWYGEPKGFETWIVALLEEGEECLSGSS